MMYMMDQTEKHGIQLRGGRLLLLFELLIKYPRVIRERKGKGWPYLIYLLGIGLAIYFGVLGLNPG